MWEMLHLRLSETFRVGPQNLDGFATLPHSYSDWLEKIDKIVEQSDPHEMNSFELFLAVLSIHLSDDGPKSAKVSVQFFGRVRVKLNSQSLGALDDRGLYHLLSIFITLVKMRNDTNHIFNGLQEILKLVPNSKLTFPSEIDLILPKTAFLLDVSRSSVLFKGLCSIYACLVKKVTKDRGLVMPVVGKAFGLITSHMEGVLTEVSLAILLINYAILIK
jgi:hypothetical protein